MAVRHIGIEDARKVLGDLVTAAQQGADVILTRNRRPVARIARYQEEGTAMTTSHTDRIHIDVPTNKLARMVLDGDDDENRARAELFHRRPHLAGFYAAAECLLRKHHEAWWDARGGFDPWSTECPDDDAPGYAVLMDAYLASIRQLAE